MKIHMPDFYVKFTNQQLDLNLCGKEAAWRQKPIQFRTFSYTESKVHSLIAKSESLGKY